MAETKSEAKIMISGAAGVSGVASVETDDLPISRYFWGGGDTCHSSLSIHVIR